jgi:hypothetical protein
VPSDPRCEKVPKPEPIESLIALALDLLAHTEAQYREARRLDGITQLLARMPSDDSADRRRAEQIREYLQGLSRMCDEQRTLVADFEKTLRAWVHAQQLT